MMYFSSNRNAQRYASFLHLVGSTEARQARKNLDLTAEQLLNFLALTGSTGRKVTVMQAMKTCPGMSTTTVHRRLKMLREQGFITFEMDEDDGRVKYLVLTDLTQRYLSQMGQHLTQATAGSS